MDYREKVFMAVAERLNITRAAESLYISQPAVTKHIHELEQKMGIALLVRKGNKIFLTQAGEILYNRLGTIENLYNELDFELSSLKGESEGSLRLGASSTIAQYVIPELLAKFHKRYPKVTLSMVAGNSKQVESLLINNEIDVALVENSSGIQELRYTAFAKDEIVAVTGSKSIYAQKDSISAAELMSAPIILREQGSGTLETLMQTFTQNNIDGSLLHAAAYLGATEAIKQFLDYYDSIAFVSRYAIRKEVKVRSLKVLQIPGLSIFRQFRIAERMGPQLTAQSLFIDFLFKNTIKAGI